MSQQPPPNLANGSSAEEGSPVVDLDKILAGSAPNTDDVPTMISKTQPAQNVIALGADSSLSNSLRGRTLAHFELLEPIGVGGMAAVIRARDKQLDRFVALKILPPEMAVDPEHVKRFHQEARAAAKLDHENIARVYFCGEDQKLHFIAFEFVEGQNLRMVMERRGRLPVKDAVHYLLQIATGLAHAASRGVVHRDIKPSNIIITPSGRAKLVDMGLARSLAPHDNRQLDAIGKSPSAPSTTFRPSKPFEPQATPTCGATSIRSAAPFITPSPASRRCPKARPPRSCTTISMWPRSIRASSMPTSPMNWQSFCTA